MLPDPLQQFMEGHRKLRSLWQAPYSPSLYSQTAKTERLLSPLGHFRKSLFQKKCHFQRNFILTIEELCNSCSPVNSKSCSSFTGFTLYQHLELAREHVQMSNDSLLVYQTTLCLSLLFAERYHFDYYCTKHGIKLVPAQGICKLSGQSNFLLRSLHSSSWRTESTALTLYSQNNFRWVKWDLMLTDRSIKIRCGI